MGIAGRDSEQPAGHIGHTGGRGRRTVRPAGVRRHHREAQPDVAPRGGRHGAPLCLLRHDGGRLAGRGRFERALSATAPGDGAGARDDRAVGPCRGRGPYGLGHRNRARRTRAGETWSGDSGPGPSLGGSPARPAAAPRTGLRTPGRERRVLRPSRPAPALRTRVRRRHTDRRGRRGVRERTGGRARERAFSTRPGDGGDSDPRLRPPVARMPGHRRARTPPNPAGNSGTCWAGCSADCWEAPDITVRP